MKNLPKINPSKALKACLPYLIAGLLCTKLGEAYRLTTGGDVIDRLLAAFTKLGLVFQNPFPSLHPFDLLVGAAAAVLGVVTAPIIAILLVATVLMQFWNNPVMVSAFNGVRVAVAAVITSAVVSLVRANVKNWLGIGLCIVGFVLIAVLHVSPVFVVLLAIVVGILLWGIRK